jgi:fused signal recognition particle receptor
MALVQKKSFFGNLSQKIGDVIMGRPSIDNELIEELEEILIQADIGMDTTLKITEKLKDDAKKQYILTPEGIKAQLQNIIAELVDKKERHNMNPNTPLIILMIGVNGGGKTTSIGKLARVFKDEGKTVLLAAADTFRAAASEQLEVWGSRSGVNVIRHKEGADPSAVIFDAIQSAKAKKIDVVICDTAGRLQNKKNLMIELEKMNKVIDREYPEAARETLLVLDATTGKNAVSQAKEFGEITNLTGIILTKLDGTAKGGIVITIADEFDIAVKFIGIGEGMNDLKVFNPEEFVGGIFNE